MNHTDDQGLGPHPIELLIVCLLALTEGLCWLINELAGFFESAPHTAYKLVRALGASSVYRITTNPAQHPPPAFDLAPSDAAAQVSSWLDEHFVPLLGAHE